MKSPHLQTCKVQYGLYIHTLKQAAILPHPLSITSLQGENYMFSYLQILRDTQIWHPNGPRVLYRAYAAAHYEGVGCKDLEVTAIS